MLDSLSVLLATLSFIIFGYFSIVRLLYKLPYGKSSRATFKSLLLDFEQNIQLLGYGTLLIALPASSLLLFWGWGPALLWLVIFHLFFETVINLRDTSGSEQLNLRVSLNNAKTNTGLLAKLPALTWQAFMVLLCAVLLAQLAQMIDQHSGLLWALLFLIPTSAILNTSHNAIPKTATQLAAAAVFCFGLILADTLGVAVYGSWTPFGFQLDWFVLNNASMTALGLLVAITMLSKNHHFAKNVASLSGYLILSCLLLLIVGIVMLRPELDAPIQSAAERNELLPSIFGLSFILFASTLALLLRLLLEHRPQSKSVVPAKFAAKQSLALMQLIFCVVSVIALAAAMGIGAWNTHYADWSWSSDFLRHFELSQNALSNLAANQSDVGSMIHTLFMAGASVVILSLLLFCVKNVSLNDDAKPTAKNFADVMIQSKLIHAVFIFLLCNYFLSHGVSLAAWALAGMLAWFLLSHHVLQMATQPISNNDKSAILFQRIYSALCLALISIGWLQLALLAANWYQTQLFAFAIAAVSLIAISAGLWLASMKQLALHFQAIKDPALFDK